MSYHLVFSTTLIVQVRYIVIEIKKGVARIGYNGFLFPHLYSGNGLGATLLLFQ